MDDFEIREIKLSDTNGIKSISEEDLGYECYINEETKYFFSDCYKY